MRRLAAGVAVLALVAVFAVVSGSGSQAAAGAPRLVPTLVPSGPTAPHRLTPVPSGATTCYVSVGRCSLQACTEYIATGAAQPVAASSGAVYVPVQVTAVRAQTATAPAAATVVRAPTVIVPAPRTVGHCRRFPAPLTSTVVRSGPPVVIRARPPTPNWTAPLAELRRRLLGGG